MADDKRKTDNSKGFEPVIEFAEGQARRGEWRKSTSRNLVCALRAVVKILDEDEPRTPQYLLDNLESLLNRWIVLTGGKTESAKDYRKRLTTLVTEYLRWEADPLNFKTEVATRTVKRRPKVEAAKRSQAPEPEVTDSLVEEFAIAGGGTFRVSWDGDERYTVADAQRLAYFLVLKASDFTPPPIVPPVSTPPAELEDGE